MLFALQPLGIRHRHRDRKRGKGLLCRDIQRRARGVESGDRPAGGRNRGWCANAWLLRVQQGSADGVDLSGRTLAIALDFPGPTLYDGNGTARLYIDDAASADQCRELEAIFQGTKGGPMEILAGLVTKWLPTHAAKIDFQEQGGTLTATVAGFGQMKSQRLTNEAGQPTTMQNTGFTTALQFDNQAAQLPQRWNALV